jgi:ribonuclease J
MAPSVTIHRSAHEIGGNCIEVALGDHRILLDIGRPLDAEPNREMDDSLVPRTLDRSRPMDAVVISHPHQDHYGLLRSLPPEWPVWSGAPTESLIGLMGDIFRLPRLRPFRHYRSSRPFRAGPFTITPFLADHSAFDAHAFLIEAGRARIFYSGDFRFSGRKAALSQRLLEHPPRDIDVLLMEGTTLGRKGAYPTESDLESEFVDLFNATPGRVFVTWSAQNIDRTVTLYRACLKSRRTLVVDLYTADVLDRLTQWSRRLPQPGWPRLLVVVTSAMADMYRYRLGRPDFVDRFHAPVGCSACRLNAPPGALVIMLRAGLLEDYQYAHVVPTSDDAWVFSMWPGYMEQHNQRVIRDWFERGGAHVTTIHTSGHASPRDLLRFAEAVKPRFLVPIHGSDWDRHTGWFPNVMRLRDGEGFAIPARGP